MFTLDQSEDVDIPGNVRILVADPREVAAAAVFFCSQDAGFITGTSLLVDGGATKGIG